MLFLVYLDKLVYSKCIESLENNLTPELMLLTNRKNQNQPWKAGEELRWRS